MIERDQIEVFSGHLSATEAYLYVRVPGLGGGGSWNLAGSLHGPHCVRGHTLPLEVPLHDLGAGPTLLARAVVPDPSYWSPHMPSLYRLSIDLREGNQTRQTTSFEFGFRFLGAADQSLFLEHRRWVLRGVEVQSASEQTLAAASAASAALIVRDPTWEICQRAGREGVFLLARLSPDPESLAGRLRQLAQHPAVLMAIVPENDVAAKTLRAASGNMLLGHGFPVASPVKAAPWADVVVCDLERPGPFAAAISNCPRPIIAVRPLAENDVSLAEARRACDALQRELAPFGDFAGYVVRIGAPSVEPQAAP